MSYFLLLDDGIGGETVTHYVGVREVNVDKTTTAKLPETKKVVKKRKTITVELK